MDRYSMKALYIFDILEIEHELLNECATTERVSEEDAKRLVAIAAGIQLMADRLIDEISEDNK